MSARARVGRWSADPRVQFIFGLDQTAARHVLADDLQAAAWQKLERLPRYEVKTQPRQKPPRVAFLPSLRMHDRSFSAE